MVMAVLRFVGREMISLVTITAHQLVRKSAQMVGMDLTATEPNVVLVAISSMDIVKSQTLASAALDGPVPDVMNASPIQAACMDTAYLLGNAFVKQIGAAYYATWI